MFENNFWLVRYKSVFLKSPTIHPHNNSAHQHIPPLQQAGDKTIR